MDTDAKISFIPKKPLAKREFLERQPVSLFLVLSFSIFFITSAVYGGSYFYARSLNNSIDAKKAQLEDIKSKFDLSIIDKARDLRERISYAQGIIDKHITLSSFFNFLGQVTLRSVGYKSFQYSSEKDGKPEVNLSGTGPDYASVALQRDALALEVGEKEHLADFSMGGYTLDQSGNVNFDLRMTLNAAPFLYQNNVSAPSTGSGVGSGVSTASSSPQVQ